MYIVIQKGARSWGVGMTPRRAMEEAIDHGAGKVPGEDLEVFPCSLGVWGWFVNTLYPEEMDDVLDIKADGSVCMRGIGRTKMTDYCPKCGASHAVEARCHACGHVF